MHFAAERLNFQSHVCHLRPDQRKDSGVPTSPKNPKVDKFLKSTKTWRKEMDALREIILTCPVVEELKWGWPCYSVEGGGNVVLIHGFKTYCALLFMKGALLRDPKGILIQQTKNVQSARQIRFTNVGEITKLATALKGYVKNAVEVEKAGLSVVKKTTDEFETPSEWLDTIDNDPDLKEAFDDLAPGAGRGLPCSSSPARSSRRRARRAWTSRRNASSRGRGCWTDDCDIETPYRPLTPAKPKVRRSQCRDPDVMSPRFSDECACSARRKKSG